MHRDVLAIVLAGGRGTRLEPLTRDRAKPAVPFGGIYRIIDFTLSNCINSDLRKILVLTQYKAVSLNRHIDQGWKFLSRELDEYIEVIPPQQRIAEHWYQGTADAIYQNVYTIEKAAPRDTLILAGDHIYKMNYAEMIAFHRERRADLTIACLPVPRLQAREFGVMDVDDAGRVAGFLEKPKDPPGMPDNPDLALASMGIYVFATDVMYELLFQDAAKKEAQRPRLRQGHHPARCSTDARVFAYPFRDENRKQAAYWRDVGHARRLLPDEHGPDPDRPDPQPLRPRLADPHLPAAVCRRRSSSTPTPTAGARRSTRSSARGRSSRAARSTAASSRPASGSTATRWSRTRSSSTASRSAATPRIRRAIIDKDVKVPAGFEIGWNREADLARGLTVTEDGVTVVAKGEDLERYMPHGW